MKPIHTLRLCLLFMLALLGGHALAQIQTIEWQGVQREYLVKTPQQAEYPVPVLYFLHGLGDNITRLDNEFHFQDIADNFKWTIVVPQALNEGYATMWNAGLMNSNTDDSGFLMALLDSLSVPYQLDLDSVFFTGFSMGGFMTHRMAIEHGDRITACAPVSGLITFSLSSQTPIAPVRMLHIHGTADPVVGYNGGSQYFGGTLGLSVEAILDYWKAANGCEGEPEIDSLPDTHNDGLRFVRYTYDCGTELQHVKVIGGNHTFYLNENQTDVSLINLIHDFFVGKNNTEDITDQPTHESMTIAPNPNEGHFSIMVENATKIQVIDLLGRVIDTQHLLPGFNFLNYDYLPEGIYVIRELGGGAIKMVLRK